MEAINDNLLGQISPETGQDISMNQSVRKSQENLNGSMMADDDIEEEKSEKIEQRADESLKIINEKDMKDHKIISQKSRLYTGITVNIKIINHIWMENLLHSIETTKDKGIINLKFDDVKILKKAVTKLTDFFRSVSIIESLCFHKVSFDDGQDFKKLIEAVQANSKMSKLAFQAMDFDEDFHGKAIGRLIIESRALKELDLSNVQFDDPKSFYEMANGLLSDRCRLLVLKLRGVTFSQLEGKVMQFVLMRNKSLQMLDLSQCKTDAPENLENVFLKFDQFCNVRTLIAENLNADINYFIDLFGEALAVNTKLEGLSLKENRLKVSQYSNFWDLMRENKSLRKIDVTKTEVTDKVCIKLAEYLSQKELRLAELNLTRNQISADGLIVIANALKINCSLKILNLSQNYLRDAGIPEFVEALKENTYLKELNLSSNKINNSGLTYLSLFLPHNESLLELDISRNYFSDTGFVDFARELASNKGLDFINLSKNKDVTDENGLKHLAQALAINQSLTKIDLTGLKIRKQVLVQFFLPALAKNIKLKKILGKIPTGVINNTLKENITIEQEILKNYKCVKKDNRRELMRHIHKTDEDQKQLNLANTGVKLLLPALKFIEYTRIHTVDLTNMQLNDESLRLIATYIKTDPPLRSLVISQNIFKDEGLNVLIQSIKYNTHLNHLGIDRCIHISDRGLKELEKIVTNINMHLYSVELNQEGHDEFLVYKIKKQTMLNREIQEHLKPEQICEGSSIEIKFSNECELAKYFDAAIKAWKIMKPTFIKAYNEGLDDSHIEKLCEFLSNRNLIDNLMLRKNKIGDEGAKAIAKYIRNADKTLKHLDLERNLINDQGGEAILKAMQANWRLESCKISFGNPLSLKICQQIQREIKANFQIKNTLVPAYKANKNCLDFYEESDRGPDFVRCALKSCQLFRILHLSLPDNMIGENAMIDIALLVSKNSPLKSLNLSQNVVNPKASLILSEAIQSNSHLRELDLSNNRLKDAGIAILLYPFIRQRLDRIERATKTFQQIKPSASKIKIDYDNNEGGSENEEQEDQDEPHSPNKNLSKAEQLSKTKNKNKKLKMKLSRIIFDKNEQSDEALKHIYTLLLLNPKIKISIDLLEERMHQLNNNKSNESISGDDEQIQEKKVVPVEVQQENLLQTIEIENTEQELVPEEENNEECLDASEIIVQKYDPPNCVKNKHCRICRQICFRDPKRPKLSLTKVFCPSYMEKRMQVNQFKNSHRYLMISENKTQVGIFIMLLLSMLSYLVFGMILPVLWFIWESKHENVSSDDKESCESLSPIPSLSVYLIFIIISVFVEFSIFGTMKFSLEGKSSQSKMVMNIYYITKLLQGQLANLSTFIQISHMAQLANCVSLKQEEEWEFMTFLQSAFALIGTVLLIFANLRRISYIFTNLRTRPDIHKVYPRAYRNIQLAWLCNFQATAVILESTSLSEYIIENGGPVIIEKKNKYGQIKRAPKVFSYSKRIVIDKMIWQDSPILGMMIIHFLSSLGSEHHDSLLMKIIELSYMVITGFSILSAQVQLGYDRPSKCVDYQMIANLIEERLSEPNERSNDKKKNKKNMNSSSESSDDQDSIGMGALKELESLADPASANRSIESNSRRMHSLDLQNYHIGEATIAPIDEMAVEHAEPDNQQSQAFLFMPKSNSQSGLVILQDLQSIHTNQNQENFDTGNFDRMNQK